MGTIIARKRRDGKPSYLCQISKKHAGRIVRENRTFRDHKTAQAWLRQREAELDNPKAFKAATQGAKTLADAIGRYVDEHREIGKTKSACLASIKRHSIASMSCADIGSKDIVAFAGTIGNFFWSGMGGTFFWIDPKEELFAIFMSQGPGQRVYTRTLVRNLVYAAVE